MPVADLQPLVNGEIERAGAGATVLEAGCGRFPHFAYADGVTIVGLDISQEQLDRNRYCDERILADVQTWQTDRRFDVVVSIFVLEHLAQPRQALANMLTWTRPGGLLLIAVPNAYSVKGLVTKLTPFWFHEAFYKYVYRRPYSIFPTTLKFCIAPRALRRFFAGHTIVHEQFSQETLGQPFGFFYDALNLGLKALTLGRYRPEDSNYYLVVRKSEDPAAAEP
jgi:2-polyprenyl-3-methyl-5-hydroxy-6-metoxy-1,4-benzoquinol methylase